ncbi:hypothetical protein GOP47_0028380 [Adiantum capillus-veneris]|nr:hypothetical protein GOP47_0028380 [Adiantum capillus-veneris]
MITSGHQALEYFVEEAIRRHIFQGETMARATVAFGKHKHVVLLSKGREAGKGTVMQSLPHKNLHVRDLPRGTLGIVVKLASTPGLALPHVSPIDDEVCTLGAAVGIVVVRPIKDLAKEQGGKPSGAKGSALSLYEPSAKSHEALKN